MEDPEALACSSGTQRSSHCVLWLGMDANGVQHSFEFLRVDPSVPLMKYLDMLAGM